MENEKLLENIRQILKKSRGEPSTFIELITCILELNQEGVTASCPKVVRKLWSDDWNQAEDKVEFETVKWDLLCKRRREINKRLYDSDLCFRFFIELNQDKQFHILSDPQEIYNKRVEEIEGSLARAKDKKEKSTAPIIELIEKLKDLENRPTEEPEDHLPNYELPEKPSIAVLPFINRSGDTEQEYFSDGITDELINALAKLNGLKVISSTSAFYFKGKDINLRTVGEKLNVENVLEGSVRKSGDKLRITVQLIKVADDTHLWAETYDREMIDLFDIQEEISQAVVKSLSIELLGIKKKALVESYAVNPKAHESFQKGKYFFRQFSPSAHQKAENFWNKAIDIDPDYAPAYTALAGLYCAHAIMGQASYMETYPKARQIVMKAIELDHKLGEAYAVLGFIKVWFEWDLKGAEKILKEAIELKPSYPPSYTFYGHCLTHMGRIEESISEFKKALNLDPVTPGTIVALGKAYMEARQFNLAIAELNKALEISQGVFLAMVFLGEAYIFKGLYDKAIAILEKGKTLYPKNNSLKGSLVIAYAKSGKKKQALKILDELIKRKNNEHIEPFKIALIYTALGDKDQAFEWLEKGYEEHEPSMITLKASIMWDDLRSDPRFIALLKKMGIED